MAMTAADDIRDHQARCQPHMFRLRMLARGEAGFGLPAVEVGEATGAIIAEAEASSRAALAAGADGSHPGAGTFLRVRLDRLTVAADEHRVILWHWSLQRERLGGPRKRTGACASYGRPVNQSRGSIRWAQPPKPFRSTATS